MKKRNLDRFYGRQGGRNLEYVPDAQQYLADIHRARLAGIRSGDWPAASIEMWRGIAAEAQERVAEGIPLTACDRRALEVARLLDEMGAAA